MAGTKFTSRTALAQIDKLLTYLDDEGGAGPGTLSLLMGISEKSVQHYLRHLRSDGLVRKLPEQEFWMAGPDPDWQPVLPAEEQRIFVACEQTGQVWREPLVAALFGPAANSATAEACA